jgi:hypothetical protein
MILNEQSAMSRVGSNPAEEGYHPAFDRPGVVGGASRKPKGMPLSAVRTS